MTIPMYSLVNKSSNTTDPSKRVEGSNESAANTKIDSRPKSLLQKILSYLFKSKISTKSKSKNKSKSNATNPTITKQDPKQSQTPTRQKKPPIAPWAFPPNTNLNSIHNSNGDTVNIGNLDAGDAWGERRVRKELKAREKRRERLRGFSRREREMLGLGQRLRL